MFFCQIVFVFSVQRELQADLPEQRMKYHYPAMKTHETDIPRLQLQYIIARFGRSLISDPKRCRALLLDLCPGYKRETAVLIAALKEKVAADIVRDIDSMPREFLISQLTRRLYENLGMAEEFARWAVLSWMYALETSVPVPEPSGLSEQIEMQDYECRKAGLKPSLHTGLSEQIEMQDSECRKAGLKPSLHTEQTELQGFDKSWWDQLDSRWKKIFRRAAGIDHDPDPDELSEIRKIESLECHTPWFRITGLEPLAQITGLKKLNCGNTRITSLEPLGSLTGLEELNCRETPVSSLEPLRNLQNLQILDCSASQITDLEPLSHHTCLRELYCCNTEISSLDPIRNLTNLQVLDCDETYIRSLEPLRNLARLRILNCSSNRIGSLEPLRGLRKLRILNCNFNNIIELKAIRHLKGLEILNCNENCISSLDPLENLTALQILNINGNPVSSLDPLQNLTDLRKLGFEDTQVRSLKAIQRLTTLQKVYCRRTGVGLYERMKFVLRHPLCDLVS